MIIPKFNIKLPDFLIIYICEYIHLDILLLLSNNLSQYLKKKNNKISLDVIILYELYKHYEFKKILEKKHISENASIGRLFTKPGNLNHLIWLESEWDNNKNDIAKVMNYTGHKIYFDENDCNIVTNFENNHNILINTAAIYGHLHIIKWLFNKYNDYPYISLNHTIYLATMNGHLSILKFLSEKQCNCIQLTTITFEATKNGHLHILKWLLNKYFHIDLPYIFENAIKYNKMNILIWSYEKIKYNFIETEEYHYLAAYSGNLDILVWLHNKNSFYTNLLLNDNTAICNIIKKGHLTILKWFYDINNEIKLVSEYCRIAFIYHKYNILNWLIENKCYHPICEVYNNMLKGDFEFID